MVLSVVRARTRAGSGAGAARSRCASPPTRRPAGTAGPSGSSRTTPTSWRTAPRRSARSAGSAPTSAASRLYLVEAAEKGMAWVRLTARGRAGHGSLINRDNAITALATAVARIGAHEWPVRLTPTMRTLLAAVAELAGTEATPENTEALVEEFGDAATDDRRRPPQHPQPHHARRRLQGERDPHGGHRPRGRTVPAGLRGRVLGDLRRAVRRGRHLRGGVSPAAVGDAVRRWAGRRHDPVPARRGPGRPRRAVPAERRHRRQALPQARHAVLRLRPRSGCPRTSTSRRCSTAVDERVPVDGLEFGARVLDRFLDEV